VILPFALRLVLSSATGHDAAIERAAISLGASRWRVFRRITLPMILPGIVSGWMLAFITSFDELTMSVFIASPSTTTLPVRMYLHIEDTIDPLVTAVSALLIFGTLVVMLVLDRMVGLERLFVGKGPAR
jgi:putative spermidine/putrescine transport system permease protein